MDVMFDTRGKKTGNHNEQNLYSTAVIRKKGRMEQRRKKIE